MEEVAEVRSYAWERMSIEVMALMVRFWGEHEMVASRKGVCDVCL